MRFLVFSDVHANEFALRAVLEAAPMHDRILCLGDIVGYGAQPNECCEALREHGALCLAGNHDAAIGGHELLQRMNAIARFSSEWTNSVLSDENRVWLASLSPYLCEEQWNFEAVHASLENPLETYIGGAISARPSWAKMRFDLCFFGHTHRAVSLAQLDVPGRKYEVVERFWKDGGRFSIESDGWKTLVNPGSVGQPRDGNPMARFAVFHAVTREVEIFAVDYDIEAARRSVEQAGLPQKLSERLLLGR